MSRSEIERLLERLIPIKSLSAEKAASNRVVEVVQEALESVKGLNITKADINGFPYLMATSGAPNSNTLWFACHLDVVPGHEKLFKLRSDESNYYGRGVFDMKGMTVALISAVKQIENAQGYNFGLIFTTDEEIGGKNGIGSLVKPGFKAGAVFVPDASSDWVLQEKMKGVLWLQIIAKGKTAHGSRPWLGENANLQLVNFLCEFNDSFQKQFIKNDPDNYYSTLNIGKISGGEAVNQVSAYAEANLDIRYVSKAEADSIIELANSTAKNYAAVTVDIQMRESNIDTNTNEKWFKISQSIIKELGIKPGPAGERLSHGSTDGRYFAEHGIPVISTRSAGGDQHAEEEWASIEGLEQMEKFCHILLLKTKQ